MTAKTPSGTGNGHSRARSASPLTRRGFLFATLGGTALAAGAAAGVRAGRSMPRVERHDLIVHGLAASLGGMRILLVADTHAGAFMQAPRLFEIARFLDGLRPDLIVIAGDMVDGAASTGDARAFAEAFGWLRPPCGVVAVPGNHDHRAGIDDILGEVRKGGITVLRGERLDIERDGGRVSLLGLDDPLTGEFDPPQPHQVAALAGSLEPGTLPILLSHRPRAFEAASDLGIPLTLAGHTHGGQLVIPGTSLTPVRVATPYVRGRYERAGSTLVVTSGVGTGQLPIRIGAPASVSEITLRRS